MYSIGEVSEMFDLPVSTLRYYDKEGLFPDMMRVSGIRKFSDRELETLRVIECLKKSGMEIKDIRQFIEWCAMGKETYPQRRAMFQRQRQNIETEIERMNQALDMLKYKCWFYDQANERCQRRSASCDDPGFYAGRDPGSLRSRPRNKIRIIFYS